ncbi:cytochrome c biogenesis protein ResB [Brevibacterium litoralis]|uniref:cytochrome c biogenesis protein ResB n=1 Tax=Brevibacterium litoralis TaxID=3138935 RepID=UPI0032EC656E
MRTTETGKKSPVPKSGGQNPAVTQPDIGVIGMLRWAWRQLTTMKVALILLLVLALAAVPGSLFPQRVQDPAAVNNWIEGNGTLGQVLDAFQFFDVYSSFWFSAVYILLMVSMVGCILPRTKQHWKAMRARPPRAPKRLGRMPGYREFDLADGTVGSADAEPAGRPEGQGASAAGNADFLALAQERLRKLGYRTTVNGDHVAAERGYLRETGNLVFHASLLGVVVTMALGSFFGYSGQRVLVEGDTFTNSLVAYDSFDTGRFSGTDDLDQFRLRLDSFDTEFDSTSDPNGAQFGAPRKFDANVTVTTGEGEEYQQVLRPNEPVRVDGSRVYVLGNGYAPVVTVKDADGNVTFSGPTVFLPEDAMYTSRGVVKVPDAGSVDTQLGFAGVLLPTASVNERNELESVFPALEYPVLVMNAWQGDLGLDEGVPQSVYSLDTDGLTQVETPDGQPLTMQLLPGDEVELGDGLGTVTFEGVERFVSLDIRHDPFQGAVLVFSVLLFLGLAGSLFVPRRRVWVRVEDGHVEVAALARGEDPGVEKAVEDLTVDLQRRWGGGAASSTGEAGATAPGATDGDDDGRKRTS